MVIESLMKICYINCKNNLTLNLMNKRLNWAVPEQVSIYLSDCKYPSHNGHILIIQSGFGPLVMVFLVYYFRQKQAGKQHSEVGHDDKSTIPTMIAEIPSSGYVNSGSSDMPVITSVKSLSNIDLNDNKSDRTEVSNISSGNGVEEDGCLITCIQLPKQRRSSEKPAIKFGEKPAPAIPQKKIRVQMVMLQKKSKGKEKSLELLEIKADCDWSSVRTNLLSKISGALSKTSESERRKDIEIDDFLVSYCKHQTNTPIPIPRHMQKPLVNPTVKEMIPVRFFVTKNKSSCTSKPMEVTERSKEEQKSPWSVNTVLEQSREKTNEVLLDIGKHKAKSRQLGPASLGSITSGGLSSFNHFRMSTGSMIKSAPGSLLSSRITINAASNKVISSPPLCTDVVENSETKTVESSIVLHSSCEIKRKHVQNISSDEKAMIGWKKQRKTEKSVMGEIRSTKDFGVVDVMKKMAVPDDANISSKTEISKVSGAKHLKDVSLPDVIYLEGKQPFVLIRDDALLATSNSKHKTAASKPTSSAGCGQKIKPSICFTESLPSSEKGTTDMPILIPEDDMAPRDDKDLCSSLSDSPPVLEPQLDSIDTTITGASVNPRRKASSPVGSSCLHKVLTGNVSASLSRNKPTSSLLELDSGDPASLQLIDVSEQSMHQQATSVNPHNPAVSQVTNVHSAVAVASLSKTMAGENTSVRVPLMKTSDTTRGLNDDAKTTSDEPTAEQNNNSNTVTASQQRPHQSTKRFSSSLQSLLLLPVSETAKPGSGSSSLIVKESCSFMSPSDRSDQDHQHVRAAPESGPKLPQADSLVEHKNVRRQAEIGDPEVEVTRKHTNKCIDPQDGVIHKYIDFDQPITIKPLIGDDCDTFLTSLDQSQLTPKPVSIKNLTLEDRLNENRVSKPQTSNFNVGILSSLSTGETVLEIKPDYNEEEEIPRPHYLTNQVHEHLKAFNSEDSTKNNLSQEENCFLDNTDLTGSDYKNVLLENVQDHQMIEVRNIDVIHTHTQSFTAANSPCMAKSLNALNLSGLGGLLCTACTALIYFNDKIIKACIISQ